MSKKKGYPHKTEPRALTEIQKEYQELCLKAGQIQYQVKVNTDELEKINERLLEVNYEAAERNQLDATAKKPVVNVTPETENA